MLRPFDSFHDLRSGSIVLSLLWIEDRGCLTATGNVIDMNRLQQQSERGEGKTK